MGVPGSMAHMRLESSQYESGRLREVSSLSPLCAGERVGVRGDAQSPETGMLYRVDIYTTR
ncbi:hypothetical protein SAMN05216367_2365 [Tardiphaga sp. OK245]|nr:hypothetical protein SAMN05216367_2365 [Tardiphaga sp. OK245]